MNQHEKMTRAALRRRSFDLAVAVAQTWLQRGMALGCLLKLFWRSSAPQVPRQRDADY